MEIELKEKAINELDKLKSEILRGNIIVSNIDLIKEVGMNMYDVYGYTGNETITLKYTNMKSITTK